MDNRSTFRYFPREFNRWSEQVASGAARWMARPSEQAGEQANPLPAKAEARRRGRGDASKARDAGLPRKTPGD